MAIHTFERTQVVATTLAECWSFFSNPRNLSRITPPALDFRVLSVLPAKIHAGLLIQYRVRPLFGFAITWLTEIAHVATPHYFVDDQRTGPYRLWHHEHFFAELEGSNVEIRDRVTYALPFGPFGDLLHRPVVRPQLEAIFAYREKAVVEIFEAGSFKAS
ncbi:MAG: hypothetical protein QOD99_540 [Chthoniobacter sp.]|jgi:ligand-binding SRPBCC domain-containing protein|nr:hypothetical protein [Chthoniobacter sp.]